VTQTYNNCAETHLGGGGMSILSSCCPTLLILTIEGQYIVPPMYSSNSSKHGIRKLCWWKYI